MLKKKLFFYHRAPFHQCSVCNKIRKGSENALMAPSLENRTPISADDAVGLREAAPACRMSHGINSLITLLSSKLEERCVLLSLLTTASLHTLVAQQMVGLKYEHRQIYKNEVNTEEQRPWDTRKGGFSRQATRIRAIQQKFGDTFQVKYRNMWIANQPVTWQQLI